MFKSYPTSKIMHYFTNGVTLKRGTFNGNKEQVYLI